MVRDSSWAQLAHVAEALQRYRVVSWYEDLSDAMLGEMREAREALWAQLMSDFSLRNRHELAGYLFIRKEGEISAEAVTLLNVLSTVLHKVERHHQDWLRKATRVS